MDEEDYPHRESENFALECINPASDIPDSMVVEGALFPFEMVGPVEYYPNFAIKFYVPEV